MRIEETKQDRPRVGRSLRLAKMSEPGGDVPSIDELLVEGRIAHNRIRDLDKTILTLRRSLLMEYLGQARRLWIANVVHGKKDKAFVVFALQIGIGRASAYELMKLHDHRAEIIKQCRADKDWPGWTVVASWYKKNDPGEPANRERPTMLNKGILTPSYQGWKVADDEYGTPRLLFAHYDRIHHFTCDVCSSPVLAKCNKFYDKATDGLAQTWSGTCWMNPPYGRRPDGSRQLGLWVRKAYQESQRGVVVVALLPIFFDSAWFHDYASHSEMELLKGRLQFENRTDRGYSPFGHMICVFRKKSARQGTRLNVKLNSSKVGTRLIEDKV